MKDAK